MKPQEKAMLKQLAVYEYSSAYKLCRFHVFVQVQAAEQTTFSIS